MMHLRERILISRKQQALGGGRTSLQRLRKHHGESPFLGNGKRTGWNRAGGAFKGARRLVGVGGKQGYKICLPIGGLGKKVRQQGIAGAKPGSALNKVAGNRGPRLRETEEFLAAVTGIFLGGGVSAGRAFEARGVAVCPNLLKKGVLFRDSEAYFYFWSRAFGLCQGFLNWGAEKMGP